MAGFSVKAITDWAQPVRTYNAATSIISQLISHMALDPHPPEKFHVRCVKSFYFSPCKYRPPNPFIYRLPPSLRLYLRTVGEEAVHRVDPRFRFKSRTGSGNSSTSNCNCNFNYSLLDFSINIFRLDIYYLLHCKSRFQCA